MTPPLSVGSNIPALVNLGIKVVELTGIKKQIVRWIKGRTILVVGMAGSGKTTFINYIQHGIFDDESRHQKTIYEEESPTFAIATGSKGSLELNVKTIVEIPGQYSAEQHAMAVSEYNPQALLIFTDLTKIDDSYEWLNFFCNTLEDQWRGKTNNKIQSIIIVLNKKDKVSLDIMDVWNAKFREMASEKLKFSRGKLSSDRIKEIPCILINNPEQTRDVDSLITKIALDLQK
jgi:GTPase SAR1 family protein